MRPPIRTALHNALRLRCPACGDGRLFAGVFRVRNECRVCGLCYYRESGYFVGAMYLDFILSAVLWMAAFAVSFFLPAHLSLSPVERNLLWFALGIALCLALMRLSYSLWLAMDYWISPWPPGAPPEGAGTASKDSHTPRRL